MIHKKSLKKSIKKQNLIEKFAPYTWGVGIEHEVHLFHAPKVGAASGPDSKPITDVTLFDGESALRRVFDAYQKGTLKLTDDEYRFLKTVPFEATGRRCNNQWVIKKVPFNMPEFITYDPFCNVRQEKHLNSYAGLTTQSKDLFIEIIKREPITREIIKKNGPLIQYPTGMTRYLKCPKNGSTPNYTFLKKRGTKEPVTQPEYVGSYHITFTLPHTDETSKEEFTQIHQNFANQLQWIEPLLLASYFSQDQFACGSKEDRVRGSFRVMIIGWGNFAGTDVRLFDQGIGRYSKSRTIPWRKGLKLYEYEKLKPCIPPSPAALAEGAQTTLSSDFRTFGSTDPERPEHRQSGVGMTKPNGVEFRIFDHFQDHLYLEPLTELIGIVAENSRVTKTTKYVYHNKYWIESMHQIMRNGYKARLPIPYVKLLNLTLGIRVPVRSYTAYDLFREVVIKLYEKNYYGDWSKIFNPILLTIPENRLPAQQTVTIPQINRNSYELSLMMKLNRKPALLRAFNKMSRALNTLLEARNSSTSPSIHHPVIVSFPDFQKMVVKYMGKVWLREADDLAYFHETHHTLLEKNKIGEITALKLIKKIPIYRNLNKKIINMYDVNHSRLNEYLLRDIMPIMVKK
jgi:hypothetical protein